MGLLSGYSVGVLDGAYVYMSHLAALDSKQPVRPVVEGPSIQGWGQIVTPMVAGEWEMLLTLCLLGIPGERTQGRFSYWLRLCFCQVSECRIQHAVCRRATWCY